LKSETNRPQNPINKIGGAGSLLGNGFYGPSNPRITNKSGIIGVSKCKNGSFSSTFNAKRLDSFGEISKFNDPFYYAVRQRLLWEKEYLDNKAPQKHLLKNTI
jgi:hypothetical protein